MTLVLLATAWAVIAPAANLPGGPFVYLETPRVEGDAPLGTEVARVLEALLRTRLQGIKGIMLRTSAELPSVTKALDAAGDLTKLDRVALVALRRETGFDGVVRSKLRADEKGLTLELGLYDLGNGTVFRTRKLEGPISSAVLSLAEQDANDLALSLRRTYRVTLEVDSAPRGAVVHVNGKPLCETPCLRELEDGKYNVEVTRDGYKSYRYQGAYRAGDRIHLVARLYNPIADRYLNRAPEWSVDSQTFALGYRYYYPNASRPLMRDMHAVTLDYLIRVARIEAGFGLRLGPSSDAATTYPSFVPSYEPRRIDGYFWIAPMAVVKGLIIEKFSFLSIWAGAALGFSDLRTDTAAQWSLAAETFVEVVTRLSRSKNFSFEAKLDLGLAYAGQLPYVDKQLTPLGTTSERTRFTPLLGPFVGLSFRFVSWNDVF